MSEEIQKSRSPNSPKMTVEDAIGTTKALLEKIGRSAVKPETAVGALGYKGINGASLTLLGALSHYGLIERSGGEVRVSPLAFKILHPVNPEQKTQAIKEAALNPRVFAEIYEKWPDMEESALANTLIHQQFTPDGAKRAATVFKANFVFANLAVPGNSQFQDGNQQTPEAAKPDQTKSTPGAGSLFDPITPSAQRPKMLATFKIPLGLSEAELIFTGEKLELEDFDALTAYIELFKKQYQRKLKTAQASADTDTPSTTKTE